MSIVNQISTIPTWPKPIKLLILGFLFLLISGVTIGLVYLFTTTSWSLSGTVEHYKGSENEADELEIKDKYAKPVSEMLLTTHNHLIGFSFIFIFICILFYFNTVIKGPLKNILMVEPFISTWLTFSSLWGIRYIGSIFVYLTFISALFTYLSFYLITVILIYDLSRRINIIDEDPDRKEL